ncbi:anthrone oxygenase family protein [Phaeobacter sp. NW0010-22]|uniref:anthrone oxygenase family protein n=1 Tax=Phaeobacter sp. NW0010-22 TaxID=3135907 RepID=UPI0031029EFB
MRFLLLPLALLSLLLSGAIFGFFYAWVCSTMWGLDQANPNVAIQAMQAMNASVRNGVFAQAFFGTPFVLLLTAFVAYRVQRSRAALCFGLGGLIYLFGGMILTMAVNVPMNEALALVETPLSPEQAQQVWSDYSAPWQVWNQIRTGFSGLTLLLTGLGLFALPQRAA